MNSKKMAATVLAATMIVALGMSSCATPEDQGASPQSSSPSATESSDSSALLLLNDSLRKRLGEDYSDAWIEGGVLHIAVTSDSGAAIVTAAGAVAKLVTIDATQLEAALQSIAAWQSKLPSEQATAIHKIIPDGSTGTITLFVDPTQLDAIAKVAATDKPGGDVALLIRESNGIATPL